GKSECWVDVGNLEAISDGDMKAPGGVALAMISNKLRSIAAFNTAGYTRLVVSTIAERQALSSFWYEDALICSADLMIQPTQMFRKESKYNLH
ncbi:hypothetical protein L195_g051180, partial [Trifolium pratense]